MEHFIRTAFWIVTLSVCLQAKSLPIMDVNDLNNKLMEKEVKCPNSTFYTPSNVEEQCMTAAMECFLTELKGTVKSECEDPRGVIDQAIAFVEHGIKKLAPEESSKCPCESWPETPFSQFLDKLESLAQQINTVALS